MLSSLTERVARRPRRALVLTAAFVVAAGVLGGPVAGVLEDSGGFSQSDSGSVRGIERIEAATGLQAGAGVVVLVSTPQGATGAAATARVGELSRQLAAEPGIATVTTAADAPGLVATDGSSTFLAATLRADADEQAVATELLDRYGDAPDVTLGGSLIAQTQIGDAVGGDLGRAEALAFPVLLVLSLLFFRGRATLLPLVVGVTTVLGSFLVLRVVDLAYGLSVFALNLVIGLGLGLAIDYSLFLLTRYRDELADHDPPLALRRTMATAGRTVLFSAATVAVALATLTVFPLGFLQSMGIAGAVVAVVAAAASLVIAPALLALWGTKVLVRRRGRAADRGGWYRLSHAVMRHPGPVALATAAVMLTIALPGLWAQFTPIDSSVIPVGQSARTVADTLRGDYPADDTSPVTVVVGAARSQAAAVTAYADGLTRLDGVAAVRPPVPLDERTWRVDVLAQGEPEGAAARDVVAAVRAGDGLPVLVGGAAADFVDQQAAIGSRLPLALTLLGLLTFLVLWLMTGSLVLPAKAIVMNALTVASSLGVLTLVFQAGRFEGLLGYTGNGGVEPTDFLVAAALVFALSTDYGVFLLGRIKEARDGVRSEREAVAVGLERTGAVVTAAAILLAVAIGAFVTSSISFIQQIGVATATGVLLDAFVVRALLVPALMGLLGSWNWWSPAPLRRLHDRVGLDESVPTVVPVTGPVAPTPSPTGPAPVGGPSTR